jgi:hypothetical protein
MGANRGTPDDRLGDYEQRLQGLKSYITELKARAAEHGTDSVHYEEDLLEAEHNLTFYEGEIARIKGTGGGGGGGSSLGGVLGGALPQTLNQSVGTLVLAALCFTAGVLIGSRLLSGRDDG